MKANAEFVRFCAVGLTCYVTGLLLIALLTEIAGLHYLLSFAVSFVITNLFGFWLNGRFSFRGSAIIDRCAAARYFSISAASLAVNSVALAALVEFGRIWYIAAVIVLTAVNVPINFVSHRILTYRVGRSAPSVPAD
jgi:putative flippase GtrA